MLNDAAALKELAPTGTLRVAIALSPAPSPFFCTKDPATGAPRGVTVTLGNELAAWTHLPLEFVVYRNSGEITERADAGEWDVTFMPADTERAKKVDFGPPYVLVESTFLVMTDSGIRDLAGIDHVGMRVAAIANTATARSAARVLKHATLLYAATVDEAVDAMRAGKADAIALSRDALEVLATKLPGTRILEGHFHSAGVAVAVPKRRPAALKAVSAFIEDAKVSGCVRRALDAVGLKHASVAPPASS